MCVADLGGAFLGVVGGDRLEVLVGVVERDPSTGGMHDLRRSRTLVSTSLSMKNIYIITE